MTNPTLLAAAALVQRGWCQKTYSLYHATSAAEYCAIGAIGHTLFIREPQTQIEWGDLHNSKYARALKKILARHYSPEDTDITEWNDNVAESAAEVAYMLILAAEELTL